MRALPRGLQRTISHCKDSQTVLRHHFLRGADVRTQGAIEWQYFSISQNAITQEEKPFLARPYSKARFRQGRSARRRARPPPSSSLPEFIPTGDVPASRIFSA